MKKRGVIAWLLLLTFVLTSCQPAEQEDEKRDYPITDIRIYEGTLAWELAKAVNSQDTDKIAKTAEKTPDILNFQDAKYGATLLFWAVGNEKYEAAEALLKAGADPNIIVTSMGGTALYVAAGYSFVDKRAKKDPKYVKLLLAYGADLNIVSENSGYGSPLLNSINCGIEKTKALVEAGADINFKTTDKQQTAAVLSLINFGTLGSEQLEYAYYLIVEKKANVADPYFRGEKNALSGENPNDAFYPVTHLIRWTCPLDSDFYSRKMEIVAEFERQGVGYWACKEKYFNGNEPGSSETLKNTKRFYPDTWEEYLKVY